MYVITMKPHAIIIEFNKLADLLDILNAVHYYKTSGFCVIRKMLVRRDKGGLKWYNDVTPYRSMPTSMLLLRLRDKTVKTAVESTHILDNSQDWANTSIIIHTVNKENALPVLMSREDFIRHMFDEWVGICTGTPY
jgi:hypothetical protein